MNSVFSDRLNVLFLCKGNSRPDRIAKGRIRHLIEKIPVLWRFLPLSAAISMALRRSPGTFSVNGLSPDEVSF